MKMIVTIGKSLCVLMVGVGLMGQLGAQVSPSEITLSLHLRDSKTNQPVVKPLTIDPRKVGIVIVDPWNYHWCTTWTEQAGGMTPRMNKALAGARKLGMAVLWAPTDTANMFCGWPQRQRAMAVPNVPVPNVRKADCRWTVPYAGVNAHDSCICGPGIGCVMNYGWDGMDPQLEITESDLIVSGAQELYSLCKARSITVLIYFGGATNICLTGKDVGLGPMYAAGMETFFALDLAFAWTAYDPAKGYTPTMGNAQAADDLERSGIATVEFVDELRKLKLWDEQWITEPVRITPSGMSDRPCFFEKSVTVTLEIPLVENAAIHHTLDGTEPTTSSPQYHKPVLLRDSATLRAAAFRGNRRVSLESRGCFIRLPAMPPKPAVYLDQLTPEADLYSQLGPVYAACLWQPHFNQSYEGQPLRIRNQRYQHGVGMRAPTYVRYQLKPEFERFVALAGVDDTMLDHNLGRNIAMHASVVFKVFVDGTMAAESPVMRISQTPWRFDVAIPQGSRQIVLVCDDAGTRSPYDLGNWVEAGFLLKKP